MKRSFAIITFLCLFSFCVFSPSIVFAQSIQTNLSFNQFNKERSMGFDGYTTVKYSVSYSSGDLDVYNFLIYDVNGNQVYSGVSGVLSVPQNLFPLKFVCENPGYQFRIDLRIEDGSDKTIDYRPNFGQVGEKLDALITALAKLDNFMSNPAPFDAAVDKLLKNMDKITDYGPMGVANDLSNLKIGAGVQSLPSLEVEFFPGEGKINVFDLSSLTGEIATIRMLMKAILYLGVVFFIMQNIVPRFKV